MAYVEHVMLKQRVLLSDTDDLLGGEELCMMRQEVNRHKRKEQREIWAE